MEFHFYHHTVGLGRGLRHGLGLGFGLEVDFDLDGDDVVAHMTGSVSTENNGGFIQFRRTITLPETLTGLRLRVRGNNQRYFVHIRTGGTVLPWQYYSAEFFASENWDDIF